MHGKWLNRISRLSASIFGLVVALGSFLPGGSRSKPPVRIPKGLSDFAQSSDKISLQDRVIFSQARRAQMQGDRGTAKRLYHELLQVHEANAVIEYNLELM